MSCINYLARWKNVSPRLRMIQQRCNSNIEHTVTIISRRFSCHLSNTRAICIHINETSYMTTTRLQILDFVWFGFMAYQPLYVI